MRKFQTLGAVVALALTGALVAAPATARTHHPSTPQERAQTRDLNLQQLAIAQGQAPANQQAMNAQPGQPAPAQPNEAAPVNQGQATPPANAPSNAQQAPAAPSDQSAPQTPPPSGGSQ